MTNTPTLLRRLAAGAAATAFAALLMAAPVTSQASHSHKKSHGKMPHKAMVRKTVYACTECKMYYPAAQAKKMGYKDPMGHTLTKMSKIPAGFAKGSKMGGMDAMHGKM